MIIIFKSQGAASKVSISVSTHVPHQRYPTLQNKFMASYFMVRNRLAAPKGQGSPSDKEYANATFQATNKIIPRSTGTSAQMVYEDTKVNAMIRGDVPRLQDLYAGAAVRIQEPQKNNKSAVGPGYGMVATYMTAKGPSKKRNNSEQPQDLGLCVAPICGNPRGVDTIAVLGKLSIPDLPWRDHLSSWTKLWWSKWNNIPCGSSTPG